jgi:hypothetical protein
MSEGKKPIRVFMGIPSTGDRCDAQCYSLRAIEERYKGQVELVYPEICVYRSFHDFARNECVEEFLASDCDVLWFLDSDIAPNDKILDLITNHWDQWEAAGACYPIWMTPPGGSSTCVLFTAYKGVLEGKGITMTEVPRGGTDFVDGLATGCMFLKRSIFDKIEKPYFEFKYNPKSRQMTEGEDLGFCLKLAKLGIKFFTDYGMVCKHYKRVCLLDINNYAVEFANSKVLAYDAEVRPKVEKLARHVAASNAAMHETLNPGRTKSGLILPGQF